MTFGLFDALAIILAVCILLQFAPDEVDHTGLTIAHAVCLRD